MNNLKRKIMLMQQSIKKSRLPSEYQEVTYIRNDVDATTSTRRGYINTDYIAKSNNIKIEIGVKFIPPVKSDMSNVSGFFGNIGSWAGSNYISLGFSSGKWLYAYSITNGVADGSAYAGQGDFDVYYDLVANFNGDNNTKTLTSNGITGNVKSFTTTDIHNFPFVLFTTSSIDSVYTVHSVECYYLRIYDDNILEVEMIPCYRKSDEVIGMYDLKRKNFFKSANSYSFYKGDDV